MTLTRYFCCWKKLLINFKSERLFCCVNMEIQEFYEDFYSKLKEKTGNDEYVDSLKELIENNEFTKEEFINLIGEYFND